MQNPPAPRSVSKQATNGNRQIQTETKLGGRYAKYVLFVLVLVYIFNFIDRQILSILAEEIKLDLGINDAQIGFLYGTVFAVFYAIFGIPLGRLADLWVRRKLIAIGLGFWSIMTALSGTAKAFGPLAAYRIGVGVGEASATPAAFSLLSDYFPANRRTTALAIYSSGIYIGAGIGIFLGGTILDYWDNAYPDTSLAPWGLKGWQASFFAVGLPGLLMAAWVYSLKEPRRGQSDGIETPTHPHPFKESFLELMSILPFSNFYSLLRYGGGSKAILINIAVAVVIAGLACLMIATLGNEVQWISLGLGIYCAFSWSQSLAAKDPAAFSMIFKTPSLMLVCIGIPCFAFVTYGVGFWGPSFFIRTHGITAAEAGQILGLSAALGGWFGVTAGGIIADKFYEKYIRAKLMVALFAVLLSLPFVYVLLTTEDLTTAYICNLLFVIFSPACIGPAVSTVNDLMLPRMRGIASAFYILMATFIGLAMGPFIMGQISDSYTVGGASSGESLKMGILWGCSVALISIILLIIAMFTIKQDLHSRTEKAQQAGEVIR